MKKRIVSFLLALVMAVSLLPVSAFAVDNTISNAGTGTNLGNCTYEGESYPVYKISLDETYDTVTFTIADDAEYNNIYLSEADEVGLFGNSSEATVARNDETYDAAKAYYAATSDSFDN